MEERRGLGSFRHHMILTTLLSTGVFAFLAGASIFLPLAQAMDRSEPGSAFSAAIAEHFLDLHRTFWPVVAGALIASIASALLLYHRMVGPLIRFRHIYRQLAAGRIPGDVSIRRHDYLTREADQLNQLLAAMRERAADREACAARCELLLDEIEALGSESDANASARITELREALKDLR